MPSLSPAVAEALPWPIKTPRAIDMKHLPAGVVRFAELYRFAVEVRPRGRPEPEPREKATYLPTYPMGAASGRESYLPTYAFLRSRAIEVETKGFL